MKLIIPAAGYATRLWPLTKDKPKHLLGVKGRPIVEYILDKIQEIDLIDEIFIVTNGKFFKHFLEWNENYTSTTRITIVNDGTKSHKDRLGALGDIKFVVDKFNIEEEVMVILGDNLFEFSYKGIIDLYNEKKKPTIVLYDVKDINLAKLYGIVSIDNNKKVIHFEEKPEQPKSTLASTGVYVYPKESLRKLVEFVNNIDNDKVGKFLEWLYRREEVYCYVTEEQWFDIGTLEQLEKARQEFQD
ncbi:MAG: nucleotidyltransferase family protein [Promethearchaeota archaeon]